MRGCQVHEGKGSKAGEEKKEERKKSMLRIRKKSKEDSLCAHPRSDP